VGVTLGIFLRKGRSRERVLSLAVGALILIEGICDQYQLSSLLAAMTFGMLMTNIAPFACRTLGELIPALAAPILIGFFVLAGAHLRADLLPALGWLGVLYLLARFAGKLGGAWLGAWVGQTSPKVRNNVGYGLLSQVGIAIGLSLVVAGEFTPLGPAGEALAMTVVNVLLGTTLVTEILGPILTHRALVRAGEAGGMDKIRGNEWAKWCWLWIFMVRDCVVQQVECVPSNHMQDGLEPNMLASIAGLFKPQHKINYLINAVADQQDIEQISITLRALYKEDRYVCSFWFVPMVGYCYHKVADWKMLIHPTTVAALVLLMTSQRPIKNIAWQ
jgi:hypothetical protein